MKQRIRKLAGSVLLIFWSAICQLNAQILKDSASVNLVRQGIEYIYNFQFSKTDEVFRKLNEAYPEHPIVYLLHGMRTYWENYPLISSSPASVSYKTYLKKCMELCEKKVDTINKAEYLLTDLCARGFLLLFYADNHLSGDVIPLAAGTYKYIRQAFDYTSFYTDFYFFTGLYDYYREAYPETYPVYKALAFLFPAGNRVKGLKELQISAANSMALKAESTSFLSWIYLTFENDFRQAVHFSKTLHDLYPDNLQYLAVLIKNYELVKRYDEAEKLIISSSADKRSNYFQAQLDILNGILLEKKYHDYKNALSFYNKGISEISHFGNYGNEFTAYAYFGMSRISELSGDKHGKKMFRKQAMELADFKKVNFDE